MLLFIDESVQIESKHRTKCLLGLPFTKAAFGIWCKQYGPPSWNYSVYHSINWELNL
jgi:hypothetical protein